MQVLANKNRTGFTIVELLIVIVVIAILAAISVVAYTGVQQRARDTQRKSDLQSISKAVELYYADEGSYPMTNGWCTQITNGVHMTNFRNAISKYLADIPYDPLYEATYQDYFYQKINANTYYLFAELEGDDRADDGITGCTRIANTNNEYDYRIPSY